jgi:hypothetical protein
VGGDNDLLNAVLRYLERKEKADPSWKLVLGREEFTPAQLRDRLQTDKKLWGKVEKWAKVLAVDMFNEGSSKIESSSG